MTFTAESVPWDRVTGALGVSGAQDRAVSAAAFWPSSGAGPGCYRRPRPVRTAQPRISES